MRSSTSSGAIGGAALALVLLGRLPTEDVRSEMEGRADGLQFALVILK